MTDYTKLVEALRCCTQNPPETCVGCTYNIGNNECAVRGMMCDAAAAIEALQAELPKHGEWHTELFDGDKKYQCSNCLTHWDVETQYCPFCGAKMDGEVEHG